MSNHRIIFYDESPQDNYKPVIETYLNSRNCITIRIEDEKNKDDFNVISLDKSTAIKFAKTLRTEINKIQDTEFNPF